jgi:hypothetical protein
MWMMAGVAKRGPTGVVKSTAELFVSDTRELGREYRGQHV